MLTDYGLRVALDSLVARAPVAVSLHVELEGRLPAPVEAAAYYMVSEGLTNVAKYAEASSATVDVTRDNGEFDRGGGRRRRRRRRSDAPARACAGSPTASRRWAGDVRVWSPPARGHARAGGDPVRVVVADDAMLLREGIVRLLHEAGFDVVGQSATAEDLLADVRAHAPDVAIVDIRMPPTHTDEGLRAALDDPRGPP